jgi:short-subunit dehydrogenase
MTNLSGAVVLVAGATGGLGSRIARDLAAAGATVVSASRTTGYDLRTPAGNDAGVAAALAQHGKLDGLVVATGEVAFGPASGLHPSTADELFALNTLGPIHLITASHAALAASAAAGGAPFVVTLSGVVAEQPVAGLAAYSASKAALASFMVAAGREYRRDGIRLLDARPGHTATQLSEHPIAGSAPQFGAALDPDAVAARIVRAIVDGEKDLPSSAFV